MRCQHLTPDGARHAFRVGGVRLFAISARAATCPLHVLRVQTMRGGVSRDKPSSTTGSDKSAKLLLAQGLMQIFRHLNTFPTKIRQRPNRCNFKTRRSVDAYYPLLTPLQKLAEPVATRRVARCEADSHTRKAHQQTLQVYQAEG